jgi:uncharacterized protein
VQPIVAALGAVAEAIGWRLVATGRAGVWRAMTAIIAAMGIAAVLARPPVVASRVAGGTALAVGAASGLLLYAGTRAFVAIASAWAPFRRHVVSSYRQAAEISMAGSLFVSLAITVPAEELFWRGLVQGRLDQSIAAFAAAAIAWVAYVAVNAASANLPILAGALVGGAVWTGLAAWSGGVLASLASHMLWTGLMLALPPGAGRGVRAG